MQLFSTFKNYQNFKGNFKPGGLQFAALPLGSVVISPFVLFFFHSVDHSRVVLLAGDPYVVGSDYINANFVGVSSWLTVDCYSSRDCVMEKLNF